ncbi:MAG: hypothetical protein ACLRZH_19445 [Ruthenibacterium lactatiformans]
MWNEEQKKQGKAARDGPQTGVPKCFLWNALVSALMAGRHYTRAPRGAGLRPAGVLVWRLLLRRWPAFAKHGPRARRHSGNGLVSSAGGGDVGRCCGDSGIFHGGRAGAILPQLAQGPLLAAAMLWEERREHKKMKDRIDRREARPDEAA